MDCKNCTHFFVAAHGFAINAGCTKELLPIPFTGNLEEFKSDIEEINEECDSFDQKGV